MEIEDIKIGRELDTRKVKAQIVKLLGKGKSGYSYLAETESKKYVLKIMHYEPCPYYSFGDMNKVIIEVGAYYKLRRFGFPIPRLVDFDADKNFLIKEYIDGNTAIDLIAKNEITESIISQLFDLAKSNGVNIDYFPSNFVINKDKLYYIDYEFNPYMQEWNLTNWGIYYWANREGIKEFLHSGTS